MLYRQKTKAIFKPISQLADSDAHRRHGYMAEKDHKTSL